ncbi:hypothetical protein BU26DRAFT_577614 [Trematosphaeria pertusa]|uniref:Uncharacterized protein n=1 Tax=Trematosphaeria pertusa TaxID=390896 RepID=A0A6A6I6Z3_9PLEO|nr:uncharacterized protein BU26DRAFT_577614 [Trematosphaeria pertusa]KAF2246106.1 hypothetical protein BU26DRAFT_577614 [Trematosphaeria pertusa]
MSFFERLNYDVRVLVYEHMDDIPPLGPGAIYSGFILACHQAKREVEEAAAKAVSKLLKHCKDECAAGREDGQVFSWPCIDIGIPTITAASNFTQLRTITITLPFSALQGFGGSYDVQGFHGVFWPLYPIFSKYFQKVSVQLIDLPSHLPSRKPLDREYFRDWVRELLSDIAAEIPFSRSRGFGFLANDKARKAAKYAAPIKTKHISFYWDTRDGADRAEDVELRGVRYRYDADERKKLGKELNSQLPMQYRVSDEKGKVEEWGLVSTNWWSLSKRENPRVLLGQEEGFTHTEWQFCYSSGIGGKIKPDIEKMQETIGDDWA